MCGTGKQTREHLFKECIAWREEIRTLWKEVARLGRDEGKGIGGARVGKGRKGFGYRVRSGLGPGNTTVRELLSTERFIEAVLGVGGLKEGDIIR